MPKGPARTRFIAVAGVTAAFVLLLLAAPLLLPFDPNLTNLTQALRAPGQDGFTLGSDNLGRDVLARTLAGGTESICMAFAVLAIVVGVGVVAGLVAGYFGGAVDYLVNKVVTAFQAFPAFVLAVAIAGILGQGMFNMVLAIAAVYWTQFARLARGIILSMRGSECLDAARTCGAPTGQILTKYLLPQAAGPVAVLAALSLSDIVLTMAGLSFIGLGPERPTNEWGTMIAEAQPSFQYALWCMLVPMAALFVAVVLFNLLGDTLRDALDARSQQVVEAARKPRLRNRLRENGRRKASREGKETA